MAIFFIASGFFFKDKDSENISSVVKAVTSKFKQLWLPFFISNAIYVLLHNFFIKINVYTSNPSIFDYVSGKHVSIINPYTLFDIIKNIIRGAFFSSIEPMFGACWFLKVLFMVSVCYLVGDYIAKKISKKHVLVIQLIVSLLMLVFGYLCSIRGVTGKGIAQTASFYILYFIGHLFAIYKNKCTDIHWKKWLILLLGSFIGLIFLNHYGSIDLAGNSYENPFFLLSTSILGWLFLYSISYFIKNVRAIKNTMICIGKNTLSVLILHFLAFKLVGIVVVAYYEVPAFCLASFPSLYGERGLWWVAYTIVGVGVPVIISVLYHKIVGKMIPSCVQRLKRIQ